LRVLQSQSLASKSTREHAQPVLLNTTKKVHAGNCKGLKRHDWSTTEGGNPALTKGKNVERNKSGGLMTAGCKGEGKRMGRQYLNYSDSGIVYLLVDARASSAGHKEKGQSAACSARSRKREIRNCRPRLTFGGTRNRCCDNRRKRGGKGGGAQKKGAFV